jgi:hypothetical protein
MEEKNIVTTDRMSAADLCKNQGSPIEFIKNPNKGTIFFTCGQITGYCSPKVQEKADTVTLDELQFGRMSIDGQPAVPILMMVGNSKQNVVRTLGV